MSDVTIRTFATIWMIARILVGECGVIPEAGPAVAQVVMNRLDAGMGYAGWHGIADVPEPSERAIEMAWRAYERGGDADGDLFALSESDILRLGFDKANWENVGSTRWPVWVGGEWR